MDFEISYMGERWDEISHLLPPSKSPKNVGFGYFKKSATLLTLLALFNKKSILIRFQVSLPNAKSKQIYKEGI